MGVLFSFQLVFFVLLAQSSHNEPCAHQAAAAIVTRPKCQKTPIGVAGVACQNGGGFVPNRHGLFIRLMQLQTLTPIINAA